MSQWPPPPPPPPPESLFGLGTVDMNNMGDVSDAMGANGSAAVAVDNNAMPATDPMQDADTMMSMLDSSVLGAFVNDMAMNIDYPDDEMYAQPLQVEPAEGTFTPTADRMIGNTVDANMPGGGPLPSGAPIQQLQPQQNNTSQSSTTTNNAPADFTKRRNWPAKIVEEMRDFLQILDANGRIKYASRSITEHAGYTTDEVRETFLKDLIHPDDQGIFVSDLNESIASGNPLRMFFRLKKKDASYAIFEAVGHAHVAASKFAPNPNNQSPFCQAVFMMARPYPTKNAGLLDSFLEHKIENERLKRRIADLRREENAAANEGSPRLSRDDRSDVSPSEATTSSTTFFRSSNSESSRAGSNLNIALTRENLEGAAAVRQADSLRDKMARYEGNSHADTIEMLTGLRYMEGERSRGITTGDASPALIKGDAGIAMPKDRDRRAVDKKNKKLKTAEEYVCTDCGTLDSPEWRKGPSGPKTLCNACGLRWAKKEKKRSSLVPLGADSTLS